jgi:hypothetical protein
MPNCFKVQLAMAAFHWRSLLVNIYFAQTAAQTTAADAAPLVKKYSNSSIQTFILCFLLC